MKESEGDKIQCDQQEQEKERERERVWTASLCIGGLSRSRGYFRSWMIPRLPRSTNSWSSEEEVFQVSSMARRRVCQKVRKKNSEHHMELHSFRRLFKSIQLKSLVLFPSHWEPLARQQTNLPKGRWSNLRVPTTRATHECVLLKHERALFAPSNATLDPHPKNMHQFGLGFRTQSIILNQERQINWQQFLDCKNRKLKRAQIFCKTNAPGSPRAFVCQISNCVRLIFLLSPFICGLPSCRSLCPSCFLLFPFVFLLVSLLAGRCLRVNNTCSIKQRPHIENCPNEALL